MPHKLSRLFSTSSKEKEREREAANGKAPSPPPPAYTKQPTDHDASNAIDPPDITAGFNNLNLKEHGNEVPQVGQCIAHLKVLECFYQLRRKVASTDGLYGINDDIVLQHGLPTKDNGELLTKLAEKRWAIYVSQAVHRFDAWTSSLFRGASMVRNSDIEALGREGRLCQPTSYTPSFSIDRTNLPPLDVLMVWHSYMLNPRAYLEDCLRLGRMSMWHAGFPWQAVVDAIDSKTFIYSVDGAVSGAFSTRIGLDWDSTSSINSKRIACPCCRVEVDVLVTTCTDSTTSTMKGQSKDSLADSIDRMLSSGSGYCDKDFTHHCTKCGTSITHDHLRADKFCKDVQLSITDDVPMGGTLLGTKGIPWEFEKCTDYMCVDTCQFPNKLIKSGLGQVILDHMASSSSEQGMEEIRNVIDSRIHEPKYIREVLGVNGVLKRGRKLAIRRMMSRYWENSSPFALDLVGAVVRQGSFIEKMHDIDWLHSPALPSTMTRLLVKYQRFVSIMADPWNMAVPTLDVDLAWHTHQLSPYSYMKYTVSKTKQFIDHDDKVAETRLNDAFAWTSKTYQKTYGEPYSECTCWYCEAVRESHTSSISRLFNSNKNQANEQLHTAEQDPKRSVHISAHNAVRPDQEVYKASAESKAKELEAHYRKACDRASKKGRKPPSRDDYYYSDAWGYPVYMPAYSPYLAWGAYTPMYYPASPGCMALNPGTYGNCCAGTCGGSVAAGGCANGAGGCAGGGPGGCAGAGGGGACGGGGGGGCGGGGGGGGCGGGGGGG